MVTATHSSRSGLDSALLLVSRLLLAYFFLPAGIGKITGFEGTVGYIASQGLPVPQLLAAAAIIAEVGGGLALIVGFQTRLVAWGLAFFTLVAGCLFHNYWTLSGAQAATQQLMFNKNLAIVGGLLALSVAGAGAWSMDSRRTGY
ncbi:DoxX family protein [Diaphorobacter aerolatus]|uniref:DoxX family protein n=1 Tax=Diaphorobacter aerolatus TaxID=1288495 RepID=A0A7H0GKD8_9BURK|nr:DoxX family protein [Diaphorobacter aerolatus]QNP48754.1 DoxX family protein [Diaphorobacter aerolatus]